MHNMSGKIYIDIMCTLYCADQHIMIIQTLAVLFIYQALHFGSINTVLHTGHDGLVNEGIGSQLIFILGNKILIQLYQIENIASLHEDQELLLGHHLAKVAVAIVYGAGLIIPGLGNGGQIIRSLVANVDLVGVVRKNLFKGADVGRQLFEIFAFGINDALGSLGGAVVDHHIGGMNQNVSGALDYAFHF